MSAGLQGGMSDHQGFSREEASVGSPSGDMRWIILSEIATRCGQVPDIHPRMLEGIEVAARRIAELNETNLRTIRRVRTFQHNWFGDGYPGGEPDLVNMERQLHSALELVEGTQDERRN